MFKKELLKAILVVAIFVIDRISKNFIIENPSYQYRYIIGSILSFNYIHNTGIAFGLMKNYNSFFLVFNTALLLFLFFIRKRFTDKLSIVAIHLIIGGAMGNIFDRIKYGYVIDFIDFKYFPAIFNFADFSISCGALILLYMGVKEAKCPGH